MANIQPLEETLPPLYDGDVVLDPQGVYWRILGTYPDQKRQRLTGLPEGYGGRVVRFDRSSSWEMIPIIEGPPQAAPPPPTREAILAQITQALGRPFPPAPRACAPRTAEQDRVVLGLATSLEEAWRRFVLVLGEKDPERQRLMLIRFEQQKEKDREYTKNMLEKTLGWTRAIPVYGWVSALVIEALKLIVGVIPWSAGPVPQDFTLESAQRYSYRGFSSFAFRAEDKLDERMAASKDWTVAEDLKADTLARFVQFVDDTLARLSSSLGVDLFCAFPSRADRGAYTMEELAQIREAASTRPERLVYFLLDEAPARYILPKIEGVTAAAPGGAAPTGTTAPPGAPPAGAPPPAAPASGEGLGGTGIALLAGGGAVTLLLVLYFALRKRKRA
jgi:hypothetical protein